MKKAFEEEERHTNESGKNLFKKINSNFNLV
jgi:hypothetical protein